jgi:fibronectin type 3 domain-containing protein
MTASYGEVPPTTQFIKLHAKKIDGSHLILSWEDPNSVIVQGYNVYSRQGAKGPFFKLNSTLLRTNQYYLTATVDSQFSFQVREVLRLNPIQVGASSLELMLSPKMRAINKKELNPAPKGYIDLVKAAQMAKWDDLNLAGLEGYNAYYCEQSKGAFIRANDIPFTNEKALLKNLKVGKEYYLVFTSVSSSGKESEPSKVLTAKALEGHFSLTTTPLP